MKLLKLLTAARERGPLSLSEEETKKRAQAAVTFARQNAGAREAVVDKRTVVVDALRRNMSFTTHGAVIEELSQESSERRVHSYSTLRQI